MEIIARRGLRLRHRFGLVAPAEARARFVTVAGGRDSELIGHFRRAASRRRLALVIEPAGERSLYRLAAHTRALNHIRICARSRSRVRVRSRTVINTRRMTLGIHLESGSRLFNCVVVRVRAATKRKRRREYQVSATRSKFRARIDFALGVDAEQF